MWKLVESLQSAFLTPKDGVGGDGEATSEAMVNPTVASPVLGNVDGERVVEKLKGYFSLGKSEIDKAVRADEWGLLEDALLHYRNANRILSEGVALPAMVESSRCLRAHTLRWFSTFELLTKLGFLGAFQIGGWSQAMETEDVQVEGQGRRKVANSGETSSRREHRSAGTHNHSDSCFLGFVGTDSAIMQSPWMILLLAFKWSHWNRDTCIWSGLFQLYHQGDRFHYWLNIHQCCFFCSIVKEARTERAYVKSLKWWIYGLFHLRSWGRT